MMSYPDALKKVLENTRVLPVEKKALDKCQGQVAAEDVRSAYALPLTPTGGPDGYAVRAEDITGASRENPVTLRIIGTVRAGFLARHPVVPGTAMRIMTGSAVPDGADCVVRFEDTDEPANKSGPNPARPTRVKIFVSLPSGENIRPAGSNTAKGALVMPRGRAIGPAQISALASVGHTSLKVYRRPVCAVIATGDELTAWGQELKPGKVFNCNSAAITSLVRHYGAIPRSLGVARDREASLAAKIQRGMTADAIITTGGVSMGDYDIVRLYIGNHGTLVLARIGIAPGASFAFGLLERGPGLAPVPIFGLSGPPVGCLNNFETLVRPALLKMMGYANTEHPTVDAIADDDDAAKRPMSFVRWTRLYQDGGEYHVALNAAANRGSLESLTMANSMVIVPPNTQIHKGDKIKVMPLDWCRDYFT